MEVILITMNKNKLILYFFLKLLFNMQIIEYIKFKI